MLFNFKVPAAAEWLEICGDRLQNELDTISHSSKRSNSSATKIRERCVRGLGKVDREVYCYEDGYQLDKHEMFVSR